MSRPDGGYPPGPRRWPKVVAALAAVVVLAGLLAGSYLLVRRTGGNGQPAAGPSTHAHPTTGSPTPERSPIDVTTRTTDPRPLSVSEVFGDDELRPDAGRDAVYRVLARGTELRHCADAASGQVGAVLGRYQCSQVIRATVSTPSKGYVATAGIANLADSDGAQDATDAIKKLGKSGHGAFTALPAPGAKGLATAPTVFTLQPYGHYLLYVVVGRTDGSAPKGDATTQQIVTDLVSGYLTGVVDARRGTD